MIRSRLIMVSLVTGISAVVATPAAHAEESVTYEVVSDEITTASIEYFDGSARQLLQDVPLPWRTDVAIANPRSASPYGAEVRVDWRSSIAAPVWRPGKWVTARIFIGKVLRCQNTLDVGNAACYGSTSFNNS